VTGPGRGIRIQAYDRPAHLIFDEDGDAYISEDYDGYVYRLGWEGTSSLWVSGFHSGDDDPFGMIFAPPGFNGPTVSEGDILVSDRGNTGADQIWAFSPDTAETEKLLMPDPGSVDQFDLAAAASDTVYVCDALDPNNLYWLDTLGILTAIPIGTPVGAIYSIVYDPAENDIYIAGGTDDAVYRVDPYSGAVTLVADGFLTLSPCCLEIESDSRRLWVSDNGMNRVYELCLSGTTGIHETVPSAAMNIEVYPNPFNPGTRIRFCLQEGSAASISMYDVSGSLVRSWGSSWFDVGQHEIEWDGRNDAGKSVGSGVYFVRIVSGRHIEGAKAVLLR
jgi:hypothetical protein